MGVEAKIVTKVLLGKILVWVKAASVGEGAHSPRAQRWEGALGPLEGCLSGARADV